MTRSLTTRFFISFAVLLCAVLALAPIVYAEDASVDASASAEVTPGTKRPGLLPILNKEIRAREEALKESIDAKRAEIKTQIETRRGEIKADVEARIGIKKEGTASTSEAKRMEMKARVEAKAKMNVENVIRNMTARLTAAIERFENISGRIDTRLEKLKAGGVDVTAAAALQVTAKAKIADAKVAVAAIVKPTISTEATREEVKAALEGVRSQVKAAEDAVKAAHKALMEVVVAMKRAGGAKADVEVSASASTNQ